MQSIHYVATRISGTPVNRSHYNHRAGRRVEPATKIQEFGKF